MQNDISNIGSPFRESEFAQNIVGSFGQRKQERGRAQSFEEANNFASNKIIRKESRRLSDGKIEL
jgi:hypothetical protein